MKRIRIIIGKGELSEKKQSLIWMNGRSSMFYKFGGTSALLLKSLCEVSLCRNQYFDLNEFEHARFQFLSWLIYLIYDGFIWWVKMNSSNEERWFFLFVCITVFHPITYTMHNLNAKFEIFSKERSGLRTLFTIRANYIEIL